MARNSAARTSRTPEKPQLPKRLNLKHFLGHLKNLRKMKAKIDHHAVRININNYLRLYQIPGEFRTIMDNGGKNKRLLIDLASIFLKHINPCAPVGKDAFSLTRQRELKQQLEKIHSENSLLLSRLMAIKHPKQPKQISSAAQQQPQSLVPAEVMRRYQRIVELPKNVALLNKIFRPKIYLELEARGERALGRITFQLYTDACPVLVLQMVRFFASGNCGKIRFPRMYLSLWAESEITVGGIEEFDCAKYYDRQALDCGSQLGVLNFALQDYNILKQGILVFTINFRPITVNDGKRFAFGKLIGGRSRFLCLHEYGTKSGKPLKEISVTSMGIL